MTTTTGFNQTFEKYIDGWAEMMITIWKERTDNPEAMPLKSNTYLYYGNYVARGVGKEFTKNNGGDLGFTPKREPKPWISGKYWYSKRKLLSKMLEQTGTYYLESIATVLRSQT
jgi:hypothetical protein